MKKSVCIALGLLTVALSSAFQQTKPPAGSYYLEQSQSTVQNQQTYSGRFEQVGTVPLDTRTEKQLQQARGDQNAATTMKLAQERANARTNMQVAAKREKEAKNPAKGSSWATGLLFLVLGFAAIIGAMKWADKNLPAAPKLKKTK